MRTAREFPERVILVFFPMPQIPFALAAVYFGLLSLIWELVAVPLKQWSFPGTQFIGWIDLFGVRFPFEEFFGWVVLFAVSILSYYELFDEECKTRQ